MHEEITEYYTLAELLDEIEDDFTSGQYDELIERLGLNGTLYVTESYHLKEHPMYGSSRLGVYKHDSLTLKWFYYKGIFDQEAGTLSDITYLDSGTTATDTIHFRRCRGQRLYELTNHLGNVLAVVTDRKLPMDSSANGRIDYYLADVVSSQDYYPFGMVMEDREYTSASYRYGFNGMEKDDELKGDGNSYDFGARIYDPRIGRWLSTDRFEWKYPDLSPYSYAANNPVFFIDVNGDTLFVSGSAADFDKFKAFLELAFDDAIKISRDNQTNQVIMEVIDPEKAKSINAAALELIDKYVNGKGKTHVELAERGTIGETFEYDQHKQVGVGGWDPDLQRLDMEDIEKIAEIEKNDGLEKDLVALGAFFHELEEGYQTQNFITDEQAAWGRAGNLEKGGYYIFHAKAEIAQGQVMGVTNVKIEKLKSPEGVGISWTNKSGKTEGRDYDYKSSTDSTIKDP